MEFNDEPHKNIYDDLDELLDNDSSKNKCDKLLSSPTKKKVTSKPQNQ